MFQVFFNWENLVPVQHFAVIEMFICWYRRIEIDPSFQMKWCTVCAASNSLEAFSWCPSLQHPPYPHPTPTSPTKDHSVTFGLYCVFILLIIFVFRVSLVRGATCILIINKEFQSVMNHPPVSGHRAKSWLASQVLWEKPGLWSKVWIETLEWASAVQYAARW